VLRKCAKEISLFTDISITIWQQLRTEPNALTSDHVLTKNEVIFYNVVTK